MMPAPRFGLTAKDYLAHRPAFAPKLYDRLKTFGAGIPGQRILDLGAGTGLFSNPLRDAGATVVCADVSHELLAHTSDGIAAAAECLPFADESFDVVCAAQCWHWFNRRLAPNEILRVLKPSGILAVIYQTYVPLPGSVAGKTEQLILKHHPNWRHANSTGINGQVLRDVQSCGFVDIESFSFDLEIGFTRENWSGFVRTTSAVGASMSPTVLSSFEAEHATLLQSIAEPFTIPHRVFAIVTRRPSRL
jgi:SAM-dependent methyltransferase